jgi:hypothetical protein
VLLGEGECDDAVEKQATLFQMQGSIGGGAEKEEKKR